jgi:beta-mannosidase
MAKARQSDSAATPYGELSLAGQFQLTSSKVKVKAPITLPGDVHTALIAENEIPDPYFGDNETRVMWVHDTPWTMERKFEATPADIDGYLTLTLENVDTIATIFLNGEVVAETQNQFIRYDIDVTGKVKAGTNTLRLEFAVTKDVAKARSDAHPFPIPFTYNYLSNGLPGVHLNFVRKTACHAGWDWGICLMPTGVYGKMAIRRSKLARQDSVTVEQSHGRKSVELAITTRVFAFAEGSVELTHEIDGQKLADKVVVRPGENVFTHNVTIKNPKLW